MDLILVKKKPHPMDACKHCPCQRFQHKGKIPNENECLRCKMCQGFEWDKSKP